MSGKISVVLVTLLLLSALSLVRSQYEGRRWFIEIERAHAASRQLEVEWNQLQLDQSTLGKHARIEEVARRDLHMIPLTAARIQYMSMEEK